jgi:hypothetical protein
MPKPVEIPGVGRFEFPDSMSMDDIAAVIERDVAPMVRERKQKREGMVAEQRALEAEPEPSVAAMTAEGFGNRVVEFGKGVVRGTAEAAIAVPEAIGVGSAALASATGVGESDPNKLATYNFAQGARKALDAVMPMDPELADEFVTGKLSQGFGAMLGMGGVSTLATKGTMAIGKKGTELAMQSAAKRAMTIAGAETGAALGGAEGYRRALRAGSTPEEAFTSFFLNSLVGTTESITLGKLFTRADKALGGELKSLLLTSGKEAGQEGFQATMANVIAKYATPEEVEVMKGVAEEAGAGGIVGFMAQALGLKFRPRGKDGIPILGPNEVIEAFDQSTKSAPLLGTAREGSAFEPSPKGKMATPEALARANELQMVSAAAAERPEGMVGPETLGPLTSDKYRREIIIQADDLLNTFKQAQQRNAERGAGGKMAPGEPAIEGAVPGFAKTAEDKLAGRDVPEIAPGIPEIAPGTPLKAVEDIIRDKLRRKDIKEAVGVLLQVPIETSGKIIDNVLRIKEKSVPLSAGELTIFNELWDATLEKMGAKVSNIPVLGKDDVIEAPPQATAEEIPTLEPDEVIEAPQQGAAAEPRTLNELQEQMRAASPGLIGTAKSEALGALVKGVAAYKGVSPDEYVKSRFAGVVQGGEPSEQALFSRADSKLAAKLDSEETVTVYRAMQLIDGKLYPPMSAKVEGQLREPTEIGVWEKADERPELATEDGMFKLDKGNKTSVPARYNPYFHTSRSPLNDQFTSASKRPNLVTVEVEVPKSELTSNYRAEKAKDTVGEKQWNAGPVSGKLPAGEKRKVILSRYAKVVRVIPDSEVAQQVASMVTKHKLTIPENVITPSLRAELAKLGVNTTKVLKKDSEGQAKASVEFDDDGKALIRALNATNVADMAHELGHVFRRDLSPEDLQVAEQWAGVKDGVWTREAEEKFAVGFERYLADGYAPTTGMRRVFEQFKQWLGEIYGAIKGSEIDVELSPALRNVLDKLVSTESAPAPSAPRGPAGPAEGFKVVPGAEPNITMLEGVEFEVNPERLLSTPPAIKRADGTIVVGDGHAKLKEQLKPLLKAGEKLTGGYVSSKTGEFLSLTEVVRAIEEEKAGDAAGAAKKFAVNSPEVKAAVEETPSVQVLKRQVAKAEADMLSREQDHKAAQRDQKDLSRNAPNYSEYVRRTKTAKTSMESAKSNVEQAQSKLDAERARKAPFVRIELNKAAQPSAAAAAKKSKVDAVVDKLQSLKTPLLPGLGSTPFPQIARAVWNTAIDIAIAAVKAGGSVTSGINAAIAHLKKNASGYDEVAVRDHLSMIVRGEAQAKAGAAAASVVSDKPSVGAPIPAKGEAFREPGPQIRGKVGDLYSEPLVERLGRVGGPVAKTVTRENLEIVARAKQLYGEISADFLDTARRVAGQAFRGGSTWVQGVRKISGNAGISKFHEIIETRAETGNWDHVPPKFREAAAIWYDANMAIGRMAEKANPLFKAGGKVQRILTSYGYDIVKRGGGKAWNMWSEALADVNGKSVDDTRQFLTKWKTELDKPGADATHLDKLAQDFKRQFPKVVTHIRPAKGMGWHAIVQSNPFSYLEQAAQRTANAVAFREVYPLAEKEGKYESSGKLEATRAAVQAEIDTNKYGNEFDNVMKALQGHPLDSITQWWMAPDSVTGAAYRALGEVTAPMRALMLSASAAVNVVETLMGGAHIFNGYGPAFKAMLRSKTLFAQLKRSGMLNASIKDFSFDPSAPIRSLSRMASNILSRGFMSEFLNEFQEFTGASSARIVADEIRAGTMSATDKQNVISTMRAMGIDTKSAKEAVEGRSPKTVQVFETKAAAFLSSGNTATAERSRLGASRFFNSLFWFHSYPMMKLNQLRSLYNNLNESVRTGDKPQQWADAKKISRYIFGTGLQGAGTLILMRLLTEGAAGLETLDKEAEDDPLAFVMNSFIQGIGGPLALAARLFERVGGVQSLASEVVGSMAPVGVVGELWDMSVGNGKYDGADFMSKVGLFIRSKTPAMRLAKRAVATLGLAKNSADLDAAISAFRRWKREEKGQLKITNELKDQEDQAKFRFHMGKVVEAMKKNDLDAYMKQMGAALSIREFEEMSYKEQQKSISSSLRSRKLLSKLEDEDLENLRKRIGDNAFQRLIDYDDMLEIEAK